MAKFLEKNAEWLNENINFPEHIFISVVSETSSHDEAGPTRGRPTKSFENLTQRMKKRKIQPILDSYSMEEISVAAEVSVRSSGKRDAANIIKELAAASPERATKIKRSREVLQKKVQQTFTSEEALALFVDMKLSTKQYRLMQTSATQKGYAIYPSYYKLRQAKRMCYPLDQYISVTDTKAEIELQGIIDHTTERIMRNCVNDPLPTQSFTIIFKWGCDGSSGHSVYKQRFSDPTLSDEYLFMISLVPLQIHTNDKEKRIIWKNPTPSSTRFCRPIKFLFEKETTALIKQETSVMDEKIQNLLPTVLLIGEENTEINHTLLMTMIDGKICNALSGESSQKCYICGAKPTQMNDEAALSERVVNVESYRFGLSTLHARIRCFETLLHISYKLPFKRWKPKQNDIAQCENRKKEIQKRFKTEMGLIVDKPRPGSGNSNDGNTARKFFEDPHKTASITEIDEELIFRFKIILIAVACGFEINTSMFEEYCKETRQIYLKLYKWYYMPPTVHKLLYHGTDIINWCILPIGQLSEEAQEARNKDLRKYREHHTRKISREATNRDLLNILLVSSDPAISSHMQKNLKSKNRIPPEALKLLNMPLSSSSSDTETESDTDNDSDGLL